MAHRPRLPPPADAEHYDDLSDLERERHQNDMRLKNTFEHIFDKYERDFTDIGDEVDLETGEIVVNNGHLARLEDERDTGEGFEEWYEEDDDDVDDVVDAYPYERYEWDGAEYEEEGEESFDELEENGQQGEDMGSIEYEDQEQVNTWAEDEEVMDLEPTTEVEDPTEATGIEDIKNPDLFQGPDDGPMKAQEFPASRNSPDPASMMPTNEVAGPTNTPAGRGNTQATPVAQPSPVGSTTETPGGTKVQKHKHHPAWIEGDNELFIVLKKDRKLSTSQICRYFPDRTVKNLENHWYKHLSRRAEEARGPMSDYVRRALERGPILANKVRQKPYKPKNLETARPHLANLTDPTELLQRYPTEAKPPKLVIPGVDITSGKPATFNPNILFREEMERTYLCVLCGKSWASHSNAREHTRKPETCIPENWLTNYQPGAHRKRALPVNGSAQEDRSSKRQKKDDSATRD
ncbi:hypothetical protein SLS55_009748 [Diplodia seriata]|uniref:C2H2-type domain-containing protein n=1 Tax=Diplodia seriata TaxID=420778 RepID=A0ABR3C449_9PEZI